MMEVRVRGDGPAGAGGTQGDVLARISPDATVAELKRAVAARAGVAPAQQRLVYSGKVLDDDASLKAYSIRDGHAVLMSSACLNLAAVPADVQSGAGSGASVYEVGRGGDDDNDEETDMLEEDIDEMWGEVESVEEFEAFVRELRWHYGVAGRSTNNTNSMAGGRPTSAAAAAAAVASGASGLSRAQRAELRRGNDDFLVSALQQRDRAAARSDNAEFSSDDDGECIELVVGFALGFGIGIVAALCLLERSGLASVRFKAGVFMGMSFYIVMLFVRFLSTLVAW